MILLPKACVRRRAIDSVVANPACPNEVAAERAVNEVWESCFNDTRPFDEVRMANPANPPYSHHDAKNMTSDLLTASLRAAVT